LTTNQHLSYSTFRYFDDELLCDDDDILELLLEENEKLELEEDIELDDPSTTTPAGISSTAVVR